MEPLFNGYCMVAIQNEKCSEIGRFLVNISVQFGVKDDNALFVIYFFSVLSFI